MHLLLRFPGIFDNHQRILAYQIVVEQLVDGLLGCPQAATDKRKGSEREIIASLQESIVSRNPINRFLAQLFIAKFRDIRFQLPLRRIHLANNDTFGSRDSLVAHKKHIHDRTQAIGSLQTGIDGRLT